MNALYENYFLVRSWFAVFVSLARRRPDAIQSLFSTSENIDAKWVCHFYRFDSAENIPEWIVTSHLVCRCRARICTNKFHFVIGSWATARSAEQQHIFDEDNIKRYWRLFSLVLLVWTAKSNIIGYFMWLWLDILAWVQFICCMCFASAIQCLYMQSATLCGIL